MSDVFSIAGEKVLFANASRCLVESGSGNVGTLRFLGDSAEHELYNFAKIFGMLQVAGVDTYFSKRTNLHECQVSITQLFPISCTVRAVANAEFANKFGVKRGSRVGDTLVEWHFHSDALSNPQITLDHIRAFAIVEPEELTAIQKAAEKIFRLMTGFFIGHNLLLGSVQLRFGKDDWGRVMLADEVGAMQLELWSTTEFHQLEQSHHQLYKVLSSKSVVQGY